MITLTRDTVAVHRLVQAVARTPAPQDPHRTESAVSDARTTAAALLGQALPDVPETRRPHRPDPLESERPEDHHRGRQPP
ncbi:hypothetical protein [Streptomyces rapamycinicus]|uniref:Uncharacterized protein n=1 Tax=Streptomyces rapamycinicus TaxID=1226757 RepID=A0ABR6LKX6_9ACTN|nr:hypothetical protein [Streptomyces rapamycinicus]AGP55425.1 hypothetical protein M271_19380 [Streptomyces rapamycinicus NRRL 5491]MBB4782985.1 hypothetical protein [Streptomyces rapamycinicus]UTO63437.1 hypothetical protein LJB45_14615 [Streptomyces rapamycinicus]UTP31394.1 hypothetical protein LIV37_19730 [Streptomyces rapamycinicus NRRL 5491]